MLLSIIIPTYNCDESIIKLIDKIYSISACPIEIILIDDGSENSSIEILKSLASKYKKVRILFCNHKGVGAARNIGIAQSQGNYITFIDDDDDIYIETYSKLINAVKRFPEVDVFSASINVNVSHSYLKYDSKKSQNCAILSVLQINNDIFKSNEYPAGPYGKIIKRSVLTQNHILFPTDIFNGEDLIFNCYVLLNSKSFFLLKDNIYKYKKNNNSLMNKYFPQLNVNNEYLFNSVCEVIEKIGSVNANDFMTYWSVRLALTNILRQHSVKITDKSMFLDDVNIIKRGMANENAKRIIDENLSKNQIFLINIIKCVPKSQVIIGVRSMKLLNTLKLLLKNSNSFNNI